MKRYVLITNIWGRQADKFYGWNYKCPSTNKLVIDKEKTEFDTMEEVNEHLALFQEYCSMFTKAVRRNRDIYKGDNLYVFDTPDTKAWGWLLGDRETMNIVWGGEKLHEYDNRTDKRVLKDILFRGPDEIPAGYKWDDGEYEGWLQFRWGDGKNAINYVKPEKPKTDKVIEKEFDNNENIYIDEHFDDSFAEEVENAYAEIESKELIKKLEDRW